MLLSETIVPEMAMTWALALNEHEETKAGSRRKSGQEGHADHRARTAEPIWLGGDWSLYDAAKAAIGDFIDTLGGATHHVDDQATKIKL